MNDGNQVQQYFSNKMKRLIFKENTISITVQHYFLAQYNGKLYILNIYSHEVVPRYRDPQLQVGKMHLYLYNLNTNICQSRKCYAPFTCKFSFF